MEQKNGSKKLIDADALWMDVIRSMDYCDDILEIIERQPAVELESDQHPGEWHREVLGGTSGYGKTVMYQCSECGSMSISQYKYCPNCGKRMLEVMYYPQVDGITAVVVKTNGGMIYR